MRKHRTMIMLGLSALTFASVPVMSACVNTNVVQNISLEVDAIPNAIYGTEVDFSGKVHVKKDNVAVNSSYTLTSLTPDTVVIDNNRPSVAVIIGVGHCKIQVSAEGATKVVEFDSYASVSKINVTNPEESFTVGQDVDLNDYVKVVVAQPAGAVGKYIATVQTTSVAALDADGHTLHLKTSGTLRVKLTDASHSQTAYFNATVVSEMQKKFASKIATFSQNYRVYTASSTSGGAFDESFPIIHTERYVAIPMAYFSTEWREQGNLSYNIMMDWDGKTYEYQADHDKANNYMPDISTIVLKERMRYTFDAYYPTTKIYSDNVLDEYHTAWSGFKSHYDANGNEDYLYKESSQSLCDAVFSTGMGLSISPSAIAEIRVNIEKAFPTDLEESLIITAVYTDNSQFKLAFTDVGEANYEPFDQYVENDANKPAPVDASIVKTTLQNLVTGGNYTVTSRTYLCEPGTETEWDYEKAVSENAGGAVWYHTMYYSGKARYTKDAMIVENVQSYEGVEGLTSSSNKHLNHGYYTKDGSVYQVAFSTEGAISSTTKLSSDITNYHDVYKTLNSFDFDSFDEFDFLNIKENNRYDFTIGPKSKKGSANIRSLTYMAQPEQTTEIFRENIEENVGESAYFGQGYIQLLENGAYRFFYYIDINAYNAVFGGYFTFRIAFDYTISDIGTTSIS